MARKAKEEIIQDNSRVIDRNIEDVMHQSMLPYSECVILDRALPRVEDGLKPVQRRILYSMLELGVTPDKPYRKAARIVGDCMGKYHPHGDSSIYEAMVRLAQPFNTNMLLVDGHGNYGSVDGDGAAAMRYTEARLAPLALELLRDIDKDTVRWSFNFDDSLKEPDILPGRYPNLLVNGASGIAVGLATNIPPHNLAEVIDGVVAYIDDPKIALPEMMGIIKAPDFPTGGYIYGGEELVNAYSTGKGKITVRAKVEIEEVSGGKKNIVVTELPYQVNKAALLQKINELRDKRKEVYAAIQDVVDESDRHGMRAVIKIKKDGNAEKILANLFKQTQLESSFAINMVAIADGRPQQMGLLDIIKYYVEYQRSVIQKRTQFDLNAAKARVHILEGLIIAIENIMEVVRIIKESKSVTDAKQQLRERFVLSEKQAQAIVDMRLSRLTKLEVESLRKEIAALNELIKELESILASKRRQFAVVRKEILDIKKRYKRERLSKIVDDKTVLEIDEAVATAAEEKEGMLLLTGAGSVKFVSHKNYRNANKEAKFCGENDMVTRALDVCSKDRLYAFTNLGNAVSFTVDDISEDKWKSRGQGVGKITTDALTNERFVALLTEKEIKGKELLFFTKQGMVKKSSAEEYLSDKKKYYPAVLLKEGDALLNVETEIEGATMLFVTEGGMCLNADKKDVPLNGRKSMGVKGMLLNDGDNAIYGGQMTEEGEIIVVTETAYAKRVINGTLDVLQRLRKGVKIQPLGGRQGEKLVFVGLVKYPYEINLFAADGAHTVNTDEINIDERVNKGSQLFKTKGKVNKVYAHKYK